MWSSRQWPTLVRRASPTPGSSSTHRPFRLSAFRGSSASAPKESPWSRPAGCAGRRKTDPAPRNRSDPHYERVRHLGGRVDPDALGLEIFANGFHAVLAANSAQLIASEGRHVADGPIGIHPDDTGLQAIRHIDRPGDTLGPDAGSQTIEDVIGDGDRFIFVLELYDGQDGPKHLLLSNAQLVVDAGEDRGLHEPTLAFDGLSAQHAGRTLLLGDVDIAQDFLVLILGRYRADMRVGTSRVAHPRRARKGEQFVQEGFIDALLHKQARAGYAGLPGRGENAGNRTLHRIVHIGVIKDDVGGLSAEFEGDFLQALRRSLIYVLPAHLAAGESRSEEHT